MAGDDDDTDDMGDDGVPIIETLEPGDVPPPTGPLSQQILDALGLNVGFHDPAIVTFGALHALAAVQRGEIGDEAKAEVLVAIRALVEKPIEPTLVERSDLRRAKKNHLQCEHFVPLKYAPIECCNCGKAGDAPAGETPMQQALPLGWKRHTTYFAMRVGGFWIALHACGDDCAKAYGFP